MIQIYHNPRCGKSRCGLEILKESGRDFEVINYLEETPTRTGLEAIIKKLKISPIELVRKNETIWKERFKDAFLSDEELINALIAFPILIERPIVVNGDKAVIGRPPENIAAII